MLSLLLCIWLIILVLLLVLSRCLASVILLSIDLDPDLVIRPYLNLLAILSIVIHVYLLLLGHLQIEVTNFPL